MVELDRRRLLLLGMAGAVSACTPGRQPTAAPVRGASPSAASALPAVHRWMPDPSDLDPRAKVAAVQSVEQRFRGDRAVVQVIDAQYGGLLDGSASVLVVTRAWRLDRQGRVHGGGSTYDVRVVRSGAGWHVTAVHPSHPGPPASEPSAAAHEVLANPRVELPPAARADVLSGRVHDSVLTAMLALARSYRVGVSVVRSGHPLLVFGTHRPSDHPAGRAFDTWRIDGRPVVAASTPRRLVTGFMEAAAAAGSYNVGGPYELDAAPQFFSDPTHHDHVHAGFTT